MSRFNTGNPLDSNDPRDLDDNAKNMDLAVNSEQDTFQDRLGKSRLTWTGIQAAGTGDTSVAVDAAARAAESAGRATDAADRAEAAEAIVDATNIKGLVNEAETARDAAFVNADVYPDVASGRAAVADGEQFQVVDGDEIVRYRRDSAGAQTEVARYPSAESLVKLRTDGPLLRNSGAEWPLTKRTFNGVVSSEHTRWSAFLLDCKVYGARPGEVFRLAYFQNGATLSGRNVYHFTIYSIDSATMASSDAETELMNARTVADDPYQPAYDPDGGIQTLEFSPRLRPSLVFYLTVNADAAGSSFISSLSSNNAGYSYIIDPAAYELGNPSSRMGGPYVNRGSAFPFKAVERDGILSPPNDWLTDFVMDCRVYGARAGKVYRINYFRNGTTGVGSMDPDNPFGIQVMEHDEDSYAEDSGAGLEVISWNDPIDDIPEDGSVHRRVVRSSVIDGLEVEIKLVSYRPANISQVAFNSISSQGWSWIIHPVNYLPSRSGEIPTDSETGDGLSYNVSDEDGTVTAIWRDGDQAFLLSVGPTGANSLPNISRLAHADIVDGEIGQFTNFYSGGTDWLPPLVLQATVGDSNSGFTGGNHLQEGQITAINDIFTTQVDGVNAGSGFDGFKSCREIRIALSHRVMAANTVADGRYIVRQNFSVTIRPGVVEVVSKVSALEEVRVRVDYGVQSTLSGVTSSLFIDGQFEGREAWTGATNSGAKSDYPDAWAGSFRTPNMDLTLWLDTDFGVGDGRYIAEDMPRVFASEGKAYTGAVRNPSPAYYLQPGEGYIWRGGYSIVTPFTDNADSKFDILKGQERVTVIVQTPTDYSAL